MKLTGKLTCRIYGTICNFIPNVQTKIFYTFMFRKFASGVVVCKVSKRLYSNITSPENNPFREAGGCSVNAMLCFTT